MRFIPTLVESFFCAAMYRNLRYKTGYGLGYSFLLVTVMTLIIALDFGMFLYREVFVAHDGKPPVFDQVVTQISGQVPVMTLENNNLVTREPRAYPIQLDIVLFHERFRGTVAVIDTTGASTHENIRTPFLITARDVIYRKKDETRIHPLSQYTNHIRGPLVINRTLIDDTAQRIIATVHEHIVLFMLMSGCCIWIGFVIVAYIARVLLLCVLAAGGMLLSGAVGTRVNFATSMRLAAASFTPVAVGSTLALVVAHRAPSTPLLMVAGLAMLLAVLIATRDEPLADAR